MKPSRQFCLEFARGIGELLNPFGQMPVPPYIRRQSDAEALRQDYQSIKEDYRAALRKLEGESSGKATAKTGTK